jgi:glycosyltransferase involved in cell wall biosynthesis
MILFDSIYINNSGGKVLLTYLLDRIQIKNNFIFLFDNRLSEDKLIEIENIFFIKPSLVKRFLAYKKKDASASLIFSFANIPPLTRYNVPTYTYFHQLKFLSDHFDVSVKEKIRLYFQRIILKYLSKNSDYFIVQSNFMAHQLSRKLNFDINKILVIPFYPPLNPSNFESISKKEKGSFIFVSGGSLHKNHFRLLHAFASHFRKTGTGKLTITISNSSKKLASLISDLTNERIPIINLGEIPRENLIEYYRKSEYLIYPSLVESFGLGLIEALEFDCKIIGSDLPYTYEVCDPSLVFDPFDVNSIENAITKATTSIIPFSKCKIENKIDDLLQIFNLND